MLSAKVAAVIAKVQEILKGGEDAGEEVLQTEGGGSEAGGSPVKLLIFSEWPAALVLVSAALEKAGVRAPVYLGSRRQLPVLRLFRRDSACRVLLCSLKKVGRGLTLTEASHLLFLETVLNPAEEAQAVGRIYRLGQRRQPHVWRSDFLFSLSPLPEEGVRRGTSALSPFWGLRLRFTVQDSVEEKVALLRESQRRRAEQSLAESEEASLEDSVRLTAEDVMTLLGGETASDAAAAQASAREDLQSAVRLPPQFSRAPAPNDAMDVCVTSEEEASNSVSAESDSEAPSAEADEGAPSLGCKINE